MLLCERMTRKSVQRYNKFLTYASFCVFFLLNRIEFYVLWTDVGSDYASYLLGIETAQLL